MDWFLYTAADDARQVRQVRRHTKPLPQTSRHDGNPCLFLRHKHMLYS